MELCKTRETLPHPSQHRYPPELREHATRMVLGAKAAGERYGVVSRAAHQLGIGPETLRHWAAKAEVGEDHRARTTWPLAWRRDGLVVVWATMVPIGLGAAKQRLALAQLALRRLGRLGVLLVERLGAHAGPGGGARPAVPSLA